MSRAMAISLNDRIRARVEQFAEELSVLIRESAMETVRDALGGVSGVARRGAAGRSRPAALPPATRNLGRGRSLSKGAKRAPEEIERLTGKLADYIKGNPGQRIEQIADGMGTDTRELNLPAKKLLASKQIKTRGQKRATTYFPR
jgi:hypothetical protein